MSRIIGLLFILLLVVLLVPPVRQRAQPYMKPALDPVYEWSARNRVKTILNILREEEQLGKPLPDPKDFGRFVDARDFQKDAHLDPWGNSYYLRLNRSSYFVGSAGRDGTMGTADDIVSTTVSRRNDSRHGR